jgi:UDPglucose 6-dehydrogenase
MKIKKICCIGAGYVGGPTMAVIALKCPEIKVTLVDKDETKIERWNGPLNDLPVYEPGLKEIVKEVRGKNLFFSTNISENIDAAEMIFIAVNTPTKTHGDGAGFAADLRYVESSANDIAKYSKSKKIVVEKSTLPVRTAEKIKDILNKNESVSFEVLSNPEFLAEGSAINDLFKSDRVLIGGDQTQSGKEAVQSLFDIYKRWIPKKKILCVNVWSSELSKLASNAMLAQRISSINSLSALCEKTDADIDEVSTAIGLDVRIGPKFLKVSPGFGGSCFKKDILNLVYLCRFYGLNEVADYWHGVVKINDFQRTRISSIIEEFCHKNNLDRKVIILGWSFKKDTNDTRESSSIYVSKNLLEKDYELHIYDPKVKLDKLKNDLSNVGLSKATIESKIKFYQSLSSILKEGIPILIMTEWDEFLELNNIELDLKVFDFRNILNRDKVIYRF